MAIFQYRLELPLRLARVRLTENRRDLAIALREIAEIEETLRRAEAMILENSREILRRGRQGITGGELAELTYERERVSNSLPAIKRRLQEAITHEEGIQDLLKAASREVKVLEKQRQEKKTVFLKEEASREQSGIDDVVLVRKARERRER